LSVPLGLSVPLLSFLAFSVGISSITTSFQHESDYEVGQGSRPSYIYDRADLINEVDEILLDDYIRKVDDVTMAEIVVYTISDFVGHGIKTGWKSKPEICWPTIFSTKSVLME
jgi:hypothetical protein